jgi:hypothetical protein
MQSPRHAFRDAAFTFDPTRREQRDFISEISVDHNGHTWIGFCDSRDIVYLSEDDTFARTVGRLKGLRKNFIELTPHNAHIGNKHPWAVNPNHISFASEINGKATIRTGDGEGEFATDHTLEELAEKLGGKRFLIFSLPTNRESKEADKLMIAKRDILGWSIPEDGFVSLKVKNPQLGSIEYILACGANYGQLGALSGRAQLPLNGYAGVLTPTIT